MVDSRDVVDALEDWSRGGGWIVGQAEHVWGVFGGRVNGADDDDEGRLGGEGEFCVVAFECCAGVGGVVLHLCIAFLGCNDCRQKILQVKM